MASRTRNFFLNSLSLILTALFMRGVGVAFNIYVSNRAGAETMGLYSLLGGVYGLFITISSAGINLGSTRLVADALGSGDIRTAVLSMKKALLRCLFSGILGSVLLFTLSGFIGRVFLTDERTIPSLRVLALSLLPISVCSCLSGYFNAVRRVKASSALQIFIQGIRIISTAALLAYMLPRGASAACLALAAGGTLSEIASLIIYFSLYLYDKKRHLTYSSDSEYTPQDNIQNKLNKITLPVTFSACIRSGLTTVQHILIPRGLKASGKSWESALSSYGILHSMVLPIILFPSVFISSFSGLLIPEVAECNVKGDTIRLRRIAFRILSLSLIFSIGVSGTMIFLSGELGDVIYKSQEASRYIKMLAPLIPIMYIDSAVDSILKGMGHQVYSMNVNIADALTSCILVFILTPRLGLYGYIISIYATEILNTSLSLSKMLSVTGMKPKIIHQTVMPLICIILSTILSNLIMSRICHHSSSPLGLTVHIFFVLILYILFLSITKTIGQDEREVIRCSLMSTEKYRKKYISD